MKEVKKAEFFAKIGALDVHPQPQRMETLWIGVGRQLVGRSTPGYLCRDEAGKYTEVRTYYLSEGV